MQSYFHFLTMKTKKQLEVSSFKNCSLYKAMKKKLF